MTAVLLAATLGLVAQDLPTDESGAIAYLETKGCRITKDAGGHAVRLTSPGKPEMTAGEYGLIGLLTHLEQAGLNGAPLHEGEWGFLKRLPALKRLSIWHGHGFATLEPFCGLKVESLTIGGCMGLRDRNKDNPNRLRHAIKTLRDLPNLKAANWYHSPLAPDDSHIAHIAGQFPTLEDLRLDFNAPRGSKTTITPAGLGPLRKLPLTKLTLESAHTFTADHFTSLAGIRTLKALLIDARRTGVSADAVEVFRKARPDVEVVVAEKGSEKPPAVSRKRK